MRTENPAADAVDHILETDPDLRRLSDVLRKQEASLRKAMTPEAFQLYLEVEATSNALLGELAERVWLAGRRSK